MKSWKNWPSWLKYWLKTAGICIAPIAFIVLLNFECLVIRKSCGNPEDMYIGLIQATIFIVIISFLIGAIMGGIAGKLKSKSKRK